MKTRSQAKHRLDQIVAASPPTPEDLHGQCVFIDGEVFQRHREALLLALRAFAATKVNTEEMACVFVVSDIANAGTRISLVAALRGGWILTPSAFCCNGGASVKLMCGLATSRTVWVSSCFRAEHAAEWLLLLQAVSVHPRQAWKIIDSAADFAAAKAKLDAAKRYQWATKLIV